MKKEVKKEVKKLTLNKATIVQLDQIAQVLGGGGSGSDKYCMTTSNINACLNDWG